MNESKKMMMTLSPARNGAAYPTLKDSKHERRMVLAGFGAAALVGLNACLGAEPPYTPPPDGGVAREDTGVQSADAGADAAGPTADAQLVGGDAGGIYALDASAPSGEDANSDPDAGTEGGDS
ncbi:MAG TPA: hypothetical protein VGK67_19030 [Myxococcales bacterium]